MSTHLSESASHSQEEMVSAARMALVISNHVPVQETVTWDVDTHPQCPDEAHAVSNDTKGRIAVIAVGAGVNATEPIIQFLADVPDLGKCGERKTVSEIGGKLQRFYLEFLSRLPDAT